MTKVSITSFFIKYFSKKNIMKIDLSIYEHSRLDYKDIVFILKCENKNLIEDLIEIAAGIKKKYCGNVVYLRGLVEYSNVCNKNCFYCGIRKDNKEVNRYVVKENEIIDVFKIAYEKKYGSVVIQSGERTDKTFVKKIDNIIKKIKQISNGELAITLSTGEQSYDVYKMWRESGAERFLLRIETSDEELYKKLHPSDELHSFISRLKALENIKKAGYQTGTGIMIGLPFQAEEHLAKDLLFMKDFDIDMCGMGPYIEHKKTPLWKFKELVPSKSKRFSLTLKMVALLRILMKDINIAATTAMQTIEKNGRIKAIKAGANVIMPNITPQKYRDDYFLYENKPKTFEAPEDHLDYLEQELKKINHEIGYGNTGTSQHFLSKRK